MTVASEITRLQGAKSCIKASIEGKGVTVGSSLKLDSYYSCINAIPNAVYLTQQEYDALPSSKLTDGIPYGIMSNGKVSKFIRNGTEYNISPSFDYIVVGGGAAGAPGVYNSSARKAGAGGGGGGGEVVVGTTKSGVGISMTVTIGAGGVCYGGTSCLATDTCLGGIVARAGCYPTAPSDGVFINGGDSGSGCSGYKYSGVGGQAGGGGGGASGEGGEGLYGNGGNGGAGLCGFGGGGGGGNTGYNSGGSATDGGGCGGQNATNYGGGGGGGCNRGTTTTRGCCGCQGVVIVCYKTDGSCGINCATGGTKTTSGDYTVHTFTTDGTFTIVS